MMTVMLSMTDGWQDGNNTLPNPSEKCRLYLLSLMKDMPISVGNVEENQSFSEDQDLDYLDDC